MIDEIYEYANMPNGNGQSTSSVAPLTPPAILPTTPSLQQLFPWLPTLPTLPPPPPPPPSPFQPFTIPTAPPPPMSIIPMGNNEEFSINNLNDDAPRASPTEMAKDMLDANKLMRAFLRTMSRDSKRVGMRKGNWIGTL
jgi:hypothetical protein